MGFHSAVVAGSVGHLLDRDSLGGLFCGRLVGVVCGTAEPPDGLAFHMAVHTLWPQSPALVAHGVGTSGATGSEQCGSGADGFSRDSGQHGWTYESVV